MTTKRAIPTYDQPMTIGPNMSSSWRRWFHDMEVGTPPSNEMQVIATGSPFAYQATARGYLIITGGTVSKVTYSRTLGVAYTTGQTQGMFPISLGDTVTITYSGTPTIVFAPS